MDYSTYNKIEKARRYSEDPSRFTFQSFSMQFHGSHRDHNVSYGDAGFHCDCEFFGTHRTCSHTMALERVLEPMLPPQESTDQQPS